MSTIMMSETLRECLAPSDLATSAMHEKRMMAIRSLGEKWVLHHNRAVRQSAPSESDVRQIALKVDRISNALGIGK